MKSRSSFVASSCCSARPGPDDPQRVDVDDVRREDDPDDGDADEREHRDRDDRARRVVVAALQVADELRHERGGEHAAEQELVDDVRRLVRVGVDAGHRRDAERVRDRRDAEEPGDARERGAEPDDRARLEQSSGVVSAVARCTRAGAQVVGAAAARGAAVATDVHAPPHGEEHARAGHQDHTDGAERRRPHAERAVSDGQRAVGRGHAHLQRERPGGARFHRHAQRRRARSGAAACASGLRGT